ncbi:MAG: flagellar basal body L-ring protein FlgH [Planctomycetes bacterium]|nr:flagellar basal body L-ring protein FlgH [Planctomycetota bacterium]
MNRTSLILALLFAPTAWTFAQSNSLFVQHQVRSEAKMAAATQPSTNGALRVDAGASVQLGPSRNSELSRLSLTAVEPAQPRVIRVNDLVGVIIRHRLRYQSDARTQQQSRWELKTKLDAWFRIHDRKLEEQDFERGTPEIKFKNDSNLQNQGRADRNNLFETRIKAKVIDIKPNGLLVLIGWAKIEIDGENQFIRFSGECHKDDMNPDGSITSDKIYALDVKTYSEGAMKDLSQRGWLKQFLDETKPF